MYSPLSLTPDNIRSENGLLKKADFVEVILLALWKTFSFSYIRNNTHTHVLEHKPNPCGFSFNGYQSSLHIISNVSCFRSGVD